MNYEVVVCHLNNDGRAWKRYSTQFVENRAHAINIADFHDAILDYKTGKREYGTCIIQHNHRLAA